MSFAIAAAGTGGHVFPGLAIAEALVARGADRSDVVFFGGDRLEAKVYPAAGFPFVQLELAALRRSLSPRNLALPLIVARAARHAAGEMRTRGIGAVLGMGSYVTVPVGWAAHRSGVPLFLHEQNAEAGLANRLLTRYATTTFVSFADTPKLRSQELAGNPIRASLAQFSRPELRHTAFARYGLEPGPPVVGVFGGSLGAGAINTAVARLARTAALPVQILHLVGRAHETEMRTLSEGSDVPWTVVGFEEEMQYFYAACDIVISRSGGAVAELAATGTPAVLVPGGFGGGHQDANARRFEEVGAAVRLPEDRLGDLAGTLEPLVVDTQLRHSMAVAARSLAHPEAAVHIAAALEKAHG